MGFLKACVCAVAVLSQAVYGDTEESIEAYVRVRDAGIAKTVEQLPARVERYASSIGCAVQINPENIVRYEVGKGLSGYVALFASDRGCTGGSAMQRPEIAVLVPGAYEQFFVDPERSRLSDVRPSVVDRLYLKDATLRYEGRNREASDALCCAIKKVRGQLMFDGAVWQFVEEGAREMDATSQRPTGATRDE